MQNLDYNMDVYGIQRAGENVMDTEHAKQMMDAFYEAKRIRDQMPSLPRGVNPSYIRILDSILQLSEKGSPVRVSDVADFQNLPRPGVTRTVKEMEKAGLIHKEADASDHRVIHLTLTEEGKALYRTYVKDYFGELTCRLEDISNEEVEETVRVIHKVKEMLR